MLFLLFYLGVFLFFFTLLSLPRGDLKLNQYIWKYDWNRQSKMIIFLIFMAISYPPQWLKQWQTDSNSGFIKKNNNNKNSTHDLDSS